MIVCADLERSTRFYRTILELPLVAEHAGWTELDLGSGVHLALYAASEVLGVRPGSVQLGFAVDDVDAFITDARFAGAVVLQEPYSLPLGRIAVIADPDGYPIQIATRAAAR